MFSRIYSGHKTGEREKKSLFRFLHCKGFPPPPPPLMARADRLSAWGVALAQTIHTLVNAQGSTFEKDMKNYNKF